MREILSPIPPVECLSTLVPGMRPRRIRSPDATIAYANTYFVYPLQGNELTRRAVYAPVRPGVERVADLDRHAARLQHAGVECPVAAEVGDVRTAAGHVAWSVT